MFKNLLAYLQYILPTRLLSLSIGYFTNNRCIWFKNLLIRWFIRHYQVDLSQAKRNTVQDYLSFNDFFTRTLKPDARSIDFDANSIISPVDGAISQIGNLKNQILIQAKGKNYRLRDLIPDNKQIESFQDGSFATLYLSPRDYHRIHMPINGKLIETTYIPGRLFAVNPTSANAIPNLFARNERVICHFETEIGNMLIVLVGALFVGSIHTSWSGKITPNRHHTIQSNDYYGQNIQLKKGDQLGHFELGSTVIMLFEPDRIKWQNQLKANCPIQFGQKIAHYK